ncbi:MAG TPA: hypothetical protein VFN55_02400 [Solirubrobacteraceae bacterium]|nr:hypothetical protein [Solirubrobacteraceae bacterium]
MSPAPEPVPARHRVVIAGGGVAAVEVAAGLGQLAGDRVHITLLTPERDFCDRPWGAQADQPLDHGKPLAVTGVAQALGAALCADRLAWVDRHAQRVHTEGGHALPYDSVAVCIGAQARVRHPHALTFEGWRDPRLSALLESVAAGRVRRIAMIVGPQPGWPLPLYELALTLAELSRSERLGLALSLYTAEHRPLESFGEPASREVYAQLREACVAVTTGAACEVPAAGRVVVARGQLPYAPGTGVRTHAADVVVALPELVGPLVRGLPAAPYGFVAVDRFCRVPGVPGAFAAGDATSFPVKHGGLAAQQADVVAAGIAARAGADVVPEPFRPRLRGVLRTGRRPLYLSADLIGGHAFSSRVSVQASWDAGEKVVAEHLGPVLARARA